MEPISTAIGIYMVASALVGGGLGAFAGRKFKTAADEARYKELNDLISKQALIIRAHEIHIAELTDRIRLIEGSRNTFKRFMWFVFESDPALYRAFGELLREEQEKNSATANVHRTIDTLKSEFPDVETGLKAVGR